MNGLPMPVLRRRRAERGFSMAEMAIGVAIFSLVMLAVMALQSISARTIKDLYGPTRSRSARMAALNEIRYRLCDGQVSSCVFSDPVAVGGSAYYRLRFRNPSLPAMSEFYFNKDEKALYYDSDVSDPDAGVVVAQGPVQISFTNGSPDVLGAEGTLVTLHVETSDDLAYSKVDLRDGDTVVYLRNPAL